jgi:hypothetical protein
VQRAIVDQLRPSSCPELTTTELAAAVLGRTDREAIRQVRRAVDGLAARGLVTTWTGRVDDPVSLDPKRPLWRSYLRPTRRSANDCTGPGCSYCAAGHTPTSSAGWVRGWSRRDEVPVPVPFVHTATWIEAPLSRVRWVAYAWEARPVAERRRLLTRWLRDAHADRERRFPDGAPHDDDGDDWAGAFASLGWRWRTERIERLEDDLAALSRLTHSEARSGSAAPTVRRGPSRPGDGRTATDPDILGASPAG